MECLDDETIAALVAGSLSAERLPAAEAHIARCPRCEQIVGDAAFGAAEGTSRMDAAPAGANGRIHRTSALFEVAPSQIRPFTATGELQPGAVVADKYLVESALGHGGMGQVFAARHLTLGHQVAIKVLRLEGSEMTARFLREAQTCAQLGNEHIVRAFDIGRLPDGAPYLVMERLMGEDLSQVIADGPVPITTAVRYVMEACTGIGAAHAAGIVHRDLKPANLFLTVRSNGSTLVKVVDFGISKLLEAADRSVNLTLTSTGMVLGSPLYMSPEQIRASREITARTDIWSLGVILYELLTGRTPFKAPSISALSVMIATEAVKRPSSLRAGIGSGLDAVVLRCLEKDPARRYSSASELSEALVLFLNGDAASITPAVAKPASLRRSTMVWSGVAVASALVAGGVTLVRLDVAPETKELSATDRQTSGAGEHTPATATAVVTAVPTVPATHPMPPPTVATSPRPRPAVSSKQPTSTQPTASTRARPTLTQPQGAQPNVVRPAPRSGQTQVPKPTLDPTATPD